ncbi:hypothetical protein DFH07DRAFT_747414, partial [Mycena maculata]
IMLSTHLLALERLLYVDHAHPSVPRQERVCRFCKTEVESPEHAMLECQASPEVLNLCVEFLENLFRAVPKLQDKMAQLTTIEFLKAIIYERSTIVLVAKYVHEVLQEFYSIPLHRP